jgi:hypothetical protein
MVVRRKYRARADHTPADVNVAVLPAPAPPAAPTQPPQGDDVSPLQRALQAQQQAEHLHAEHLKHQHATRAQVGLPEPPLDPARRHAIDQHIDGLPNLTDHKRRFLKAHPSLLSQPYLHLMGHAYQLALHAGVPDDTPAMDAAVLAGIHRDLEHHRQLSRLTSASAAPTAENAQMHEDLHRHVAELQAEAEQHLAAHQPEPVASPPSPPHRRSLPMQAPVSRDAPSVSGYRQGSNHLTAEEVRIAHNSFTDPNMSNREKELLYLKNKQRYNAMKADGSYSVQRDG